MAQNICPGSEQPINAFPGYMGDVCPVCEMYIRVRVDSTVGVHRISVKNHDRYLRRQQRDREIHGVQPLKRSALFSLVPVDQAPEGTLVNFRSVNFLVYLDDDGQQRIGVVHEATFKPDFIKPDGELGRQVIALAGAQDGSRE